MQEWVRVVFRSDHLLQLQLKDPSWLDVSVFPKAEVDELCVCCVLHDEKNAVISYTVDSMITLHDVFAQHIFEKEEGYCFLLKLMDDMMAVNRNKPVLFDPDFVFVAPFGDAFRFIVVPVKTELWMEQKERMQNWIKTLSSLFQTTTAFEIPGYLMKVIDAPEFSLPDVILGLKNMRQRYYPVRYAFFFRRRTNDIFRVQEPMHHLYDTKTEAPVQSTEKTQIIGTLDKQSAYLEINGERYDLISEWILVGRAMSCDIRLNSTGVSLKHAKILCQNDRCYIQDLKSKNGTYLNEKKVIRRMRLKEGMKIRFADVEGIFHES